MLSKRAGVRRPAQRIGCCCCCCHDAATQTLLPPCPIVPTPPRLGRLRNPTHSTDCKTVLSVQMGWISVQQLDATSLKPGTSKQVWLGSQSTAASAGLRILTPWANGSDPIFLGFRTAAGGGKGDLGCQQLNLLNGLLGLGRPLDMGGHGQPSVSAWRSTQQHTSHRQLAQRAAALSAQRSKHCACPSMLCRQAAAGHGRQARAHLPVTRVGHL